MSSAEIGIALGFGLSDGGFGVFCCLLDDLVVAGQGRERHELRGPLVAGHVRMLARLMVWQVDDVVVCMGLLQGHARWPPI